MSASNFFSPEALGLLNLLQKPVYDGPRYTIVLEVQHQAYNEHCITEVTLPYEYPTFDNARVMLDEFTSMHPRDLFFCLQDQPSLHIGEVLKATGKLVRL